MSDIFEIVKKLRNKENVIIPNNYSFTVMQQIQDHADEIGYLEPIKFKPYDDKHTLLTLDIQTKQITPGN